MGQEKAHRRDSRGTKEGDRPKILMDSPEDADIFHGEDLKVGGGSFIKSIRGFVEAQTVCQ